MKTIITIALFSGIYILSNSIIDQTLYDTIVENGITPMEKPEVNSLKVKLGQRLFFDKILSGNKDVACATCHHPSLNSADGLSLPIGVGGEGMGTTRRLGYNRTHIPRNSPDLFNRGAQEWHSMFWDSRVSTLPHGFKSPADEQLPEGFDNLLAVQAMFPVFSRDEMRGEIGDVTVLGEENELALMSNAAPQSVWNGIMKRLLAIKEYRKLFKSVYPTIPLEELGFQHAANAIAAFEIDAFTYLDSPWDQYLAGNEHALSEQQKIGALLFFGKAGCVNCHSGNLMTDQQHHNIGIPQLGPGKGNTEPLDIGRYAETGQPEQRFAFRTPPLRNVATTAPYMHNGAYLSLEAAIQHHLDPINALNNYDPNQLPEGLRDSYIEDEKIKTKILNTLDPRLTMPDLNHEEQKALLAFMYALTDQGLHKVHQTLLKKVPSGLPVDQVK